MKKSLLFSLCATAVSTLSAQTAYLECGFSDGIPPGFLLFDEDALEPSTEMKNVGFDIGIPWIALTEDDGNKSAVSTSWYRKTGTSDDWMVTQPFSVGSHRAVLQWKARSGDKEYRDGYSVYVSESAVTPDEFRNLTPVFSASQEKDVWTDHEVSLSDFEGKTVRVAFVNNTRDRATLWIDDIFAGIPAALRIDSDIKRVVNTDGILTVKGTVTNVSDEDVDGFALTYRFGDGPTHEYHSDVTVPAGKSVKVEFPSECAIERNSTLPYSLTVSTGDNSYTATGSVSCLYRRIVAEEVTGVWCGYCVRGIVAMRNMKEMYPDSFLGIAVHGSSSGWEDPMEFGAYTDYLFESMGMSGYPHVTVNRRKSQTGDPADLAGYYVQLLGRDLKAGLSLSVGGYDECSRMLALHTDMFFIDDMDDIDYGLAYVLIENDVHRDAIVGDDGKPLALNGYEQNNYYSGGGSMGGFESLPAIVPGPDMTYQDVARAFWGGGLDGFEGISGSVPVTVKADMQYGHDYTVALPDNMLDEWNAELAALLINGDTGEIINADVVSLRPWISGIRDLRSDGDGIKVTRNGSSFTLSCTSDIDEVGVYGIDGRTVMLYSPGTGEFRLETGGLMGTYVIRARAGIHSTVRKVVL